MINLIHGELFKLKKSKLFWSLLLLITAAAIALAVLSNMVAEGKFGMDITASASGVGEVMIISLLGSLMAGIVVCGDFETSTIHDEIAVSGGRHSIVISKFFVFTLVIAALMVPYIIVTLIAFSSGKEFADPFIVSVFSGIMAKNASVTVTAGSIGKILAISLAEILVYASKLSICIPVGFKTRKTIAVVSIGFASSFFLDLIFGLLSKNDLLEKIIKITPFSKKYLLLTMDTGAGDIVMAMVTSLIFMAVMVLITWKLFNKAEVK